MRCVISTWKIRLVVTIPLLFYTAWINATTITGGCDRSLYCKQRFGSFAWRFRSSTIPFRSCCMGWHINLSIVLQNDHSHGQAVPLFLSSPRKNSTTFKRNSKMGLTLKAVIAIRNWKVTNLGCFRNQWFCIPP